MKKRIESMERTLARKDQKIASLRNEQQKQNDAWRRKLGLLRQKIGNLRMSSMPPMHAMKPTLWRVPNMWSNAAIAIRDLVPKAPEIRLTSRL